jgi:hypothetical protein
MGTIDSIVSGLTSHADPKALSSTEKGILDKLDEPQKSQQTAMLQLQHYQELVQTLSTMLKTLHEINQGIIQNMR